jgi:hypothetical protein
MRTQAMHLPNARDTKTQTVSAAGIRRGDVITVRGRSCAVVDLRDIGLTHKLLQLANGTTHLLPRAQTIQVTRLHDTPTAHHTP